MTTRREFPLRVLIRFWESVDITETCWQWNKSLVCFGYGQFSVNGKNYRAHRYSLLIHGVEIPQDMVVDHICKNRGCVNPEHLRVVTNRINVLENSNSTPAQLIKRTHCKNGHPLSGSNLRMYKQTIRRCRECNKAYWPKRDYKSEHYREYRRRKRLEQRYKTQSN